MNIISRVLSSVLILTAISISPSVAQSNRAALTAQNNSTFYNCGNGCITGSTLNTYHGLQLNSFGVLNDNNTWSGFNTYSQPPAIQGCTGPIYGNGASALSCTEDLSGNYNVNASTLAHWRAAVARVRAGTGRGKLLVVGDSTSAGAGAGTGGGTNTTAAYPKNWETLLAKQLSVYIPTNDNTLLGDQNIVGAAQQTSYALYDPRVTLGGGWNIATGLGGLGANFFNTSSAGTLAFAPSGSVDTVVVWYTTSGGLGTFTTNVDGGTSLGTISQSGSSAFVSTSYSVTAGTHTFNILWASGNIYVSGAAAYLSTTPAIDFYHSAWFGATANYVASPSSAWSPVNAIPVLAPDLTIINLTINDSNYGTAVPSYTASVQALITAAKATGDCLLMVGPPSNTTQATNGTLAQYVAALQSLAASNGCAMVDIKTRWVSYAFTNPLMAYYDSLHPTGQGYQDIAQAVAKVLSQP